MDTRTKEVSTEYGTTTIEITDCDSCGNTVPIDEAVEFTIDDRSGHACEYCANNGPISFPERVIEWSLPTDQYGNTGPAIVVFILFAPFFLIPIFFDAMFAEKTMEYFADGYIYGVIAVLLWVVLPLVVYIL
jgi:hypothetical protein